MSSNCWTIAASFRDYSSCALLQLRGEVKCQKVTLNWSKTKLPLIWFENHNENHRIRVVLGCIGTVRTDRFGKKPHWCILCLPSFSFIFLPVFLFFLKILVWFFFPSSLFYRQCIPGNPVWITSQRWQTNNGHGNGFLAIIEGWCKELISI